MRLAVASALSLAVVLGPERTRADVYTWVDESGTVHFSEEPPAPGGRARKVILPDDEPPVDAGGAASASTSSATEPQTAPVQAPAPRPLATPRALPKVELFTTSWCPHCKRARAYFHGKGIPFTEHDIEREPGAADRLLTLTGGRAIPTAVIGGKLVRGYSPGEYQAALGAR